LVAHAEDVSLEGETSQKMLQPLVMASAGRRECCVHLPALGMVKVGYVKIHKQY